MGKGNMHHRLSGGVAFNAPDSSMGSVYDTTKKVLRSAKKTLADQGELITYANLALITGLSKKQIVAFLKNYPLEREFMKVEWRKPPGAKKRIIPNNDVM